MAKPEDEESEARMAMNFAMAPTVAPREQQWRIFDLAHKLHAMLVDAPQEERLAVYATAAALAIGEELFSTEDDERALDYLRRTAALLVPEVKGQLAHALKQRSQ